jgi:predicted thioesterase
VLRNREAIAMDVNLSPGLTGEKKEIVSSDNTAIRYGSGGVSVYATPAMIALMEGAAVQAVDAHLPEGMSTVGTSLAIQHTAATPVGLAVRATAHLTEVDGRRLVFSVQAFDEREQIGSGTHERYVVSTRKFLEKAEAKK